MQIQENISLKPYNTFGINATARYFAKFTSAEELDEVYNFDSSNKDLTTLVIGGGSNILLTQDYKGLVAKNELHGIEVVSQDEANVYVRAAAGENWHGFVEYCIQNDFAGVENLSLIPGNVGASPMQKIVNLVTARAFLKENIKGSM
jgi:UDP-N-acetylmuramate dehydrogenase